MLTTVYSKIVILPYFHTSFTDHTKKRRCWEFFINCSLTFRRKKVKAWYTTLECIRAVLQGSSRW